MGRSLSSPSLQLGEERHSELETVLGELHGALGRKDDRPTRPGQLVRRIDERRRDPVSGCLDGDDLDVLRDRLEGIRLPLVFIHCATHQPRRKRKSTRTTYYCYPNHKYE